MTKNNRVDDESILWRGRPAPRCYTFRLWKQAIAGSILFLVSSFWLMNALQLIRDGYPLWLLLFPVPIIAGSFIFGPMQIIMARWRWPHIFYVMTETHLLAPHVAVPLASVVEVKMKKQGDKLASLRIGSASGQKLILYCIEQPDSLFSLLTEHCPQLKN
ncbi:MAG: hypothetical protein L3J63_13000 [Geopsychrobacter sp.]|nr:hypothetical protein [Geopsychrobacter sp.]